MQVRGTWEHRRTPLPARGSEQRGWFAFVSRGWTKSIAEGKRLHCCQGTKDQASANRIFFFRDVFFPLVLLEMQRHTNRKGQINKHL